MEELVYSLLVILGLFVLAPIGIYVATSKNRRRERALSALGEKLGFSWYATGVRDRGLDELNARRLEERPPRYRPGDTRLEGTYQGYHVSIAPREDHGVVLMLQRAFPAYMSITIPDEGPLPRMAPFDTGVPRLQSRLTRCQVREGYEARIPVDALVRFFDKWGDALVRFDIEPQRVGLHFRRGGTDLRPRFRYLENDDIEAVLPDLVQLARAADDATSSRGQTPEAAPSVRVDGG